jgi:hypothetical protein
MCANDALVYPPYLLGDADKAGTSWLTPFSEALREVTLPPISLSGLRDVEPDRAR